MSKGSQAGFPDWIAIGPIDKPDQIRIIIVENKIQGENPTPAQRMWLALWIRLANIINVAVGKEIIQVYIWRPIDLLSGKIDEILSRKI